MSEAAVYPPGGMADESLQSLLATAVAAAEAAGPVIRSYFGSQRLGLERKQDGSPVTLADREAERVIRARLATAPGAPLDILGEEEGLSGTGTRWRWTVDPIDGTRSFVRGIPLCGSMIGLEDTADGRALLGVIHLPMLGVTYAGAAGPRRNAKRRADLSCPTRSRSRTPSSAPATSPSSPRRGAWRTTGNSSRCTATCAAIRTASATAS